MCKRVIILGASGTIGQIVAEDLSAHYDLTLVDVHQAAGGACRTLDIAKDYAGLKRVIADQHAILHLACVEETETAHDNLQMTKNIFRAALETNPPPRVIVASSIHAVGGYLNWEREPYASIARGAATPEILARAQITLTHPPQPNGLYGAMKVYLESLGAFYASRGLEVVAIRFGGVRKDDHLAAEIGYHVFWLSRRDCAQMIRRTIDAELPPQSDLWLREPCQGNQTDAKKSSVALSPFPVEGRFVLVFAVSNNRYRIHDLSVAENILGFKPQDDSWRLEQMRTS